jgi:hypothetical protein
MRNETPLTLAIMYAVLLLIPRARAATIIGFPVWFV